MVTFTKRFGFGCSGSAMAWVYLPSYTVTCPKCKGCGLVVSLCGSRFEECPDCDPNGEIGVLNEAACKANPDLAAIYDEVECWDREAKRDAIDQEYYRSTNEQWEARCEAKQKAEAKKRIDLARLTTWLGYEYCELAR